MRIHFLRHGESEANVLHTFSNRGWKHPLTEKGIHQAKTAGARLSAIQFSRVYSSPVLRAIQTTSILSEAVAFHRFTVDENLREYDVGLFEDRSDSSSWKEYYEMEDQWAEASQQSKSIAQGESFLDIQKRFKAFVDALLRDDELRGKNVLAVTHAGLLKVGLPAIAGNVSYEFTRNHIVGNCEEIVVEHTGVGRCVSWGEQTL